MDGRSAPLPVDALIARLAARQHGVVARRQLEALGLSRGQIEARVRLGRLHRIHTGVYAVGHTRLTWEGRLMAAVLAAGDGAILSNVTAAALWGLLSVTAGRIHVTLPTRAGRAPRPPLAIHRPRRAPGTDEITTCRGIPVTTVARTLLDLAGTARPADLRRAVDRADELRLLDPRAVEAVLAAHPASRGRRRLGHAVAAVTDPGLTRSVLERRFIDLCRSHGLPRPEVNAVVADLEVDFLWRDARLVVETDGFAHHGTRRAFERDRERDALLSRAGLRVLRFTHRQVCDDPASVAATVGTLVPGARVLRR